MKERIVGAVILVALAVLVVPVFLDGPPESGEVVTERVPLPGQSDQETQTVVLARDRDEPVPAPPKPAPRETVARTAAEPAAGQQPAADDSGSAAAPTAAETSAPEPAGGNAEPGAGDDTDSGDSATGMWAVQLGSFSNQENAERLAADLRKQNFAAFLSRLATSSGELHRVRVGPLENREAAEAMAERLAEAGQSGQVVPHP